MTYALDSSAVLRYLDGEAGSMRVAEIIKEHLAGRLKVVMSAVHWGEVAGVTAKAHGTGTLTTVMSRLTAFGIETVPVTAERAVRAALIKIRRKIAYVDAFGVELVTGQADQVLVTADFDLKAAAHDVRIEFLPKK